MKPPSERRAERWPIADLMQDWTYDLPKFLLAVAAGCVFAYLVSPRHRIDPLYRQLLYVILAVLVLGFVGVSFALHERLERELGPFSNPMGTASPEQFLQFVRSAADQYIALLRERPFSPVRTESPPERNPEEEALGFERELLAYLLAQQIRRQGQRPGTHETVEHEPEHR